MAFCQASGGHRQSCGSCSAKRPRWTACSAMQVLIDDGRNTHSMTTLGEIAKLGTITECTELLLSIQSSLRKCKQIHGEHGQNLGRRILWLFQEKETKNKLTQLSRIRDHLATALTADATYGPFSPCRCRRVLPLDPAE
jgi:hypothetical protein